MDKGGGGGSGGGANACGGAGAGCIAGADGQGSIRATTFVRIRAAYPDKGAPALARSDLVNALRPARTPTFWSSMETSGVARPLPPLLLPSPQSAPPPRPQPR